MSETTIPKETQEEQKPAKRFTTNTCLHTDTYSLTIRIPYHHVSFTAYESAPSWGPARDLAIFGMTPEEIINMGLTIMKAGLALQPEEK